MAGAVRISGEAALRVGAGLVSVATRKEHIAAINAARPEIMCHGVACVADLTVLLEKATVVIIGPGLGQSDWSKLLFHAAINLNKPMVVDADALNLLSQSPQKNSNWILTPHLGEASRLLGNTMVAIQENRLLSAENLVKKYSGVVVLKGAGTIVAAENAAPTMSHFGNPGMGSGGMGDALSGVIGGLLAQHFTLLDATKIGVIIHAKAGDMAAKAKGERGLLAMDLMDYFRKLVNP
ncbi:MAG: Carbohydrate kinase family [uncultured bacterium]|nr:MAG: Carbohydrate kinase family [uncultured bacterium]